MHSLKTPIDIQIKRLSYEWQMLFAQPYVTKALIPLKNYIDSRIRKGVTIYPARPFYLLQNLEPAKIRVIILGQDPYHGPGQAQGVAFSVAKDNKAPPSLKNIHKELLMEYPGILSLPHDLSSWVKQGVFLLNAVLTVEEGKPGSHARRGWEIITDTLITHIAKDKRPKVFLLWGNSARAKKVLIHPDRKHLVLSASHPSPFSARRSPFPFLGCGHFRKTNEWLMQKGMKPIEWSLVPNFSSHLIGINLE